MDHTNAQAWLDQYVAAWRSYDPAAIGALFADDVAYRYHPYDEPIRAPVAVDGDTVVAQGTTTYRKVPDGPVHQVYDNCFVMRFTEQGRCRGFTELYVLRPSSD